MASIGGRTSKMVRESFVERMKEHQIFWARQSGFEQLLEPRRGNRPSWVLKAGFKEKNLKEKAWWQYIKGKEHRWARSLLSSQCFAVNLFAPLVEKPMLAKRVLQVLLPHRTIEKDDEVSVVFEHTPKGAREWLGEVKTHQPTQVDVVFTIQRFKTHIGYLLLEVKFTEQGFGVCRGAVKSTGAKPGNPDSSRCLNLQSILAQPKEMCWMAGEKENGRHYWDYMQAPDAPFNFPINGPCPFRSLYQLMRNEVLALALVKNASAEWAEFGVCIHHGNAQVRQLSEPIAGHTDALRAFGQLLPRQKILEIDPLNVLRTAREHDASLSEWADWMISRYELQ